MQFLLAINCFALLAFSLTLFVFDFTTVLAKIYRFFIFFGLLFVTIAEALEWRLSMAMAYYGPVLSWWLSWLLKLLH